MRDYKKEYREYHSSKTQKLRRAMRNKANRSLSPGPGKEVDHKTPLSAGGSNSESNWRVVSKSTNRKKYNKTADLKGYLYDNAGVLVATPLGAAIGYNSGDEPSRVNALAGGSLGVGFGLGVDHFRKEGLKYFLKRPVELAATKALTTAGGLAGGLPGAAAGAALGTRYGSKLDKKLSEELPSKIDALKSYLYDNAGVLIGAPTGTILGYTYDDDPSLLNSVAGTSMGAGFGLGIDMLRREGLDFFRKRPAELLSSKALSTVGGVVGGLPGAAVGALAGANLGSKIDKQLQSKTASDERKIRPRVALWLHDGKGNLLVQDDRHRGLGFKFPSGGVDPGQSINEAARREALEEVGYSLAESPKAIPGIRAVNVKWDPVFLAEAAKKGRNFWGSRHYHRIARAGAEDRSLLGSEGDALNASWVPAADLLRETQNAAADPNNKYNYFDRERLRVAEVVSKLLRERSSGPVKESSFDGPIGSFLKLSDKGVAKKTNPAKWEAAKREAKSKMGGKHSARAMQLATQIYKKKGGGYSGKKPSAKSNKLKKWTKQDWQWSGERKKKASALPFSIKDLPAGAATSIAANFLASKAGLSKELVDSLTSVGLHSGVGLSSGLRRSKDGLHLEDVLYPASFSYVGGLPVSLLAKNPDKGAADFANTMLGFGGGLYGHHKAQQARRQRAKIEKLSGSKGVYLPAKSIDAYKSSDKGKAKLRAAVSKKNKATAKGEQFSSHGLHKGKKRSEV